MQYIGESTWIGELGRILIILAFSTAFFSTISLLFSKENKQVINLGKWSFVIHAISIFSVVGLLFYMLVGHYFEYDYVWKHSSLDLEKRFVFSAFWEGQEGSFLLWMFWHCVLGLILLFTAKKWTAPTVGFLAMIQLILTTMLLGVYIGDLQIGISPFVLIRELPENAMLPWTRLPDYLQQIEAFSDGTGLNPLLQNYWMTIHPPTLFLGFASVAIPFVYALSGLLRKDHKSWIKPALPWTFFSITILGTGILMGGAWAYEALSFGGFWAWDPVENASLVPWLILVGGGHLMLIERNRGGAAHTMYIFILAAFFFILYSTFLTRSGILGEASVHSFVDLGLNGQLLILLFTFLVIPAFFYFRAYKTIPKSDGNEEFWSREFWMFIGSLILFISAFQIIFSTSIPVIDKIVGPEGLIPIFADHLAPPIDEIAHYNAWQIPFAIAIGFLMAVTQFLSYRKSRLKWTWVPLARSLALALLLTVVFALPYELYKNPLYILLLLSGWYVVIANFDYWISITKAKIAFSGSSIAHVGFGLLIVGSLISNGAKKYISKSPVYLSENFPAQENLLVELNDTVKMADFAVTFTGTEQIAHRRYYFMDYLRANKEGGYDYDFTLSPHLQINDQMGLVAEPSTKHYLHKDIFTHLTYAADMDKRGDDEGYGEEMEFLMAKGDTFIVNRHFVILDSIIAEPVYHSDNSIQRLGIEAVIRVMSTTGDVFYARPKYAIEDDETVHEDYIVEEAQIKLRFEDVNLEENKLLIISRQKVDNDDEFVVLKAIIFPWINLLWAGCILMAVGGFMSVYQRIKRSRVAKTES
jgi:cytochrome c-type biogenesis protein CcmF